jgi:hypothetical protein
MLSNDAGEVRRGGMASMMVGASDHGGWDGGGGGKPLKAAREGHFFFVVAGTAVDLFCAHQFPDN